MKNFIIKTSLLFILLISQTPHLIAGGYEDAMKKNIDLMDNMKSVDDANSLANNFDRIADKEKSQWLPYYYSALVRVIGIYMEEKPENVESRMDVAQEAIDKALGMDGVDSSEAYCIQSMIASARIMENPMKLGMKYGPMSAKYLGMAQALNPQNPRVYLLQGESKFYTPPMWGGSKKEAKALFLIAQEKFETQELASDITPQWGADRVEEYLGQLD